MNFTYLVDAISIKSFVKQEAVVTTLLVAASIAGVFSSPLWVIAAIFGHGCWDVAKHFGAGVPFFAWYTWPCFIVDTIYSAALLFYWVQL